MKVRDDSPKFARLPWRASLAALASASLALLGLFPTSAFAISRTSVLTRAHSWVAKRVTYSQRAHYAGYRRDCSGFVSMAWQLGRSYTSSTIHSVARHIPLSKLRPGDAVHTPGHVAIFVRWANKAHTRYVAMEESLRGRPALHHVRALGHKATGLRYRRIVEDPILVAAVEPLTGVSAGVADAVPVAASVASLPVLDTTKAAGAPAATTASETTASPSVIASPLVGVYALVPLY